MLHIYDQPQFGENWFTYPNLYRMLVAEASPGGKIVEVGVWKGKSVAFLTVEAMNSGKNLSIYAVDTWEGSPEHSGTIEVQTNTLYQVFLNNIQPIKDHITTMRMSSLDASVQFADESLDAVFIDAAHDYVNVKKDIAAWYPKVKRGGIVAGHDFPAYEGVVKAVTELFPGGVYAQELCWWVKKS